MGTDYLLVHVKYTVPPAVLLSILYRPLQTRLDTCKILFLLAIAVLSTIPWDSYLIANNVWTYPPGAVIGLTLFRIPIEELFFFFVQTYITTLIYLLVNKATVHAAYLTEINDSAKAQVTKLRVAEAAGAVLLAGLLFEAADMVRSGGEGTYMGLLGVWAGPFLLGLWVLAYRHILSLPLPNTLVPALLPTVYFWVVDTLALRRGTWAITPGTKLNYQPWPHMEIEEVVFFLTTNVLITFGLVCFDYAVALTTAFPSLFPESQPPLHKQLLFGISALFTCKFPRDAYHSLPECIAILRAKSRSFYLASGVFEGRLRLDLISLYSFCRAADDLIDDSPTPAQSLERLRLLLEIIYTPSRADTKEGFVRSMFPAWAHTPLLALPSQHIPRKLLDELLDGFEMDMGFSSVGNWPIATYSDLERYAHYVAGTVGEMFTHLVLAHSFSSVSSPSHILADAEKMGRALQYVNISRDIRKDAAMHRVYVPAAWLKEARFTPEDVVRRPEVGERFRGRLLEKAEVLYRESRAAIEQLPVEARGGARVAVEAYMDIGRRLGMRRQSKLERAARAWSVMRR
ncbi:Squalene/phytoene synthase-domain-containing protein [Sphaerosporella brunnea]|uniref:Bifunctional lycopene cyclase/phytoene synthase n=1 Tax=Sphaerosporella brunnea TaxID=1250544 RepID=A0A5J5F1N5_9PEZI|nr:Squalene/phytoene synthase-domain-containing protein [Sphaerosporella brunnea]